MAAKGVLVDAGPLVAILNERDQHHAACRVAAAMLHGPFFTCWPVITEAAYLLKSRPTAVEKLLGRIRSAKIRLLSLTADDVEAMSRILSKYADQRFDLADAALMYLAQREAITTVFTVDQRHFSTYRTVEGAPLTLVPATL